MLLRAALRRRGYDVESTPSGEAALAWLATHQVDLILAHVRMNGMSGVELCAAVRAAHPDLLTIVVTGDGMLDGAVAALRAGAYDYIAKPIDLDALVLAIERAIAHVTMGR